MNKIIILFVLAIAAFFANVQTTYGQCNCTNCPLALPDGAQETFNLTVSGAASNTLATNPITSVVLAYNHTWPGDLTITLTSPGGESITLVGTTCILGCGSDINGTFTFLPNSSGATTWSNASSPWLTTGNYRPYSGTLESLDLGTVNGNWEIFVSDNQGGDTGGFTNFSINFTNPTNIVCSSSVGALVCPTVSYSQETPIDTYTNTGNNINNNNYCQSDAPIGLISDSTPDIATFPPDGSNDQPGYFLRITGDSYSDTEQSMSVNQPGATPPVSFDYLIGDFITGDNDFMGWYFKAGSPVTFSVCDSYGDGNLPYQLYDLNGTLVSSGTLSFTTAGQCINLVITPAGSAVYSGTGVTDQGDGTAIFTPSLVPNPDPVAGTSVPIVYTWDNGAGCTGTETQTVKVWPTVTSTKVADGSCSVPAETSKDKANYTATYTVSYTTGSGAVSGSGFTFTPPASSSGNVTFTVTNPNAPASLAGGCKTKQVVVPFACSAVCPSAPAAVNSTAAVCSGSGTGTLVAWQTARAAAVAGVDNASTVSTVEYSTAMPTSAVPATGNTTVTGTIPAGCASVAQAITAYMRCDNGTAGDATDDTWTAIGMYTLTVYPAVQVPAIATSGCAVTITGVCAGDLVTLSGAPATGTITNNGTNAATYTAAPGDAAGTLNYSVATGVVGSTCAANTGSNATPACAAIPTASVNADITDPCFCVTPPVLNAANIVTTAGILGDEMVITTSPATTGIVWTVVAGANTTITSGGTAVDNGDGSYSIDVTYTDNGSGWAVTATPAAPNAGFGVQNGAGGTSCTYTIGTFTPPVAAACSAVTISGASPAGGTYNPTSIAAPAPGAAAQNNVPLQYTYNAFPAVGANPACPLTLNATINLPACPVSCAASTNMLWGN